MLRSILQKHREDLVFNRDKGDWFERFIRAYLKTDPQYVGLFSDVWLWKNWPDREDLGYKLPDQGIDLVAKMRDEAGFCAIQCKFYDSPISLDDLGTFFTLSGKGGFVRRLIVATAPLNRNAMAALDGQQIPVQLLTLEDLEASPVDWSEFSFERPEHLRKRAPKRPFPHQEEAAADVLKGFEASDRGKLVMACGTGKTYVSLMIAEQMVSRGGHVLYLVPSIALLSQTLRAWTSDSSLPLRCFAVCSDTKASRDEEDMRIVELAYPATTDAGKLALAMTATRDENRLTVVFSTYQSIGVVEKAQKRAGVEFDLIVCDEAHRTAGYTQKGDDPSAFVLVHDNARIRGGRRLYMTATPRIYNPKSVAKAKEAQVEVFSMNDEEKYGPEFHRLRFDEAVRRDLLSDYKVLVLAVDERYVNDVLGMRLDDQGDELDIKDAPKILGCWHGLGKHYTEEDDADLSVDPTPMRTAIAFAGSIKHSKLLAGEFQRIAEEMGEDAPYLPALEAEHVDGTMNVVERNRKIGWLTQGGSDDRPLCRILTNARCLSEGVDVPALDAAIFLNPRDSVVDVVQSVGRIMRKAPGKKYGYVILPIGVRKEDDPEKALDKNEKYRVVWQVLNALRAHDDRLDKQFATLDLTGKKGKGPVNVIGVGSGRERPDRPTPPDDLLLFNPAELEKWQDALFAKIAQKCGPSGYLEQWATEVGEIAQRHQMRIRAMLEDPTPEQRRAFDTFLDGLRRNLNPSIDQDEAIEMLAQHIITRPVFDALFEGYTFAERNPVSQAMQAIIEVLDRKALSKDHNVLEDFYADVRRRVEGIHDRAARQKIITELYDKFFKIAFPKMVERLGIVYTPVEIVDFMIRSADEALQKHFGCRLQDQGVHILDPFVGTGTFLVRMIESGLLPHERLREKYLEELHANEIVLLAYYIAAINIEEAFHHVTEQEYEPFPGIVLTDTFQMSEGDSQLERFGIPENSERVQRQKERDIRVIVSNPPWSVGQVNANDNNQNLEYLHLDERIAQTYAAQSKATLKRNLYDSYVRAFRWASDRLNGEGVVCFVTNASWIDANAMDGFRASLEQEFAEIYVFNLRGNQRTAGDMSRREGGKIFGAGSRAPVAITVLVKKRSQEGRAKIYHHDIGNYLGREEKLGIVAAFGGYSSVPWEEIEPNEHHDWINQRSEDYQSLVPFNDAPDAIFATRSLGVVTARDAWVYNFSRLDLSANMQRSIAFYNDQVGLHRVASLARAAGGDVVKVAADLVDTDPHKMKWTYRVLADLARGRMARFDQQRIGVSMYRPFCKTMLYYDPQFNERYKERLYPTIHHSNLSIVVPGPGMRHQFSRFIVDVLPDLHINPTDAQCFPLHYYEPASSSEAELFEVGTSGDGYVRRDGITDAALVSFRDHYGDASIMKEDIFYYCYGVLHAPEYGERYAADLKKAFPRIPLTADFRAFNHAGRELADWHLGYEQVEPWPLDEERADQGDLDDYAYYRVEKMDFASLGGREKDRSMIVFNSRIRLKGIPLEAYGYIVNGKSAIEWIMERYQVTTDPDSGIANDPNEWCREHNEPRYILDLIKRIVRVSMETNRIVAGLPSID